MLSELRRVCVGAESKPNETRRALTPGAVRELRDHGVEVGVQRYPNCAFGIDAYEKMGAEIVDTTQWYDIVFATKEWSPTWDVPKQMHRFQTLVGFHHVHKGQRHNLSMLKRAQEVKASLFDYELFRLPDGSQPITTSRYAGIAGAANGLWALAQRLGLDPELCSLPQPGQFGTNDILRAKMTEKSIGKADFRIVVVGKTGVCGKGALEVCNWLGIPSITPAQLLNDTPPGPWFCGLGTEDIVERVQGGDFNHDEYRKHGATLYRSNFERYLGKFNLLIFCPYWDNRYPKILPQELMVKMRDHLPLVVSDVTCDLGGSTQCTLEENHVDTPVSTYFPDSHRMELGFQVDGMTVTAVDNLPAQLGISCSTFVSAQLMKHAVWSLLRMDTTKPLEESGLPEHFWPAFVTYRGELNPRYQHLQELL